MRARIAERLVWLGIGLDATANNKGSSLISKKDSRIPVYVIPTNEELMIARHTLELLSTQRAPKVGTTGG
jgi:acetate kinase